MMNQYVEKEIERYKNAKIVHIKSGKWWYIFMPWNWKWLFRKRKLKYRFTLVEN